MIFILVVDVEKLPRVSATQNSKIEVSDHLQAPIDQTQIIHQILHCNRLLAIAASVSSFENLIQSLNSLHVDFKSRLGGVFITEDTMEADENIHSEIAAHPFVKTNNIKIFNSLSKSVHSDLKTFYRNLHNNDLKKNIPNRNSPSFKEVLKVCFSNKY